MRYFQATLCDKKLKDYFVVNYATYAISSSTILSLFYQDSEEENHFCAALAMIFFLKEPIYKQ